MAISNSLYTLFSLVLRKKRFQEAKLGVFWRNWRKPTKAYVRTAKPNNDNNLELKRQRI